MRRRLVTAVLVLLGAALGALGGRIAAGARRQIDEGAPLALAPEALSLDWREVIPGLLAAMRSGERPWSYLGVPPWLAALGVNFCFVAFARELEPIRRAAGLDFDFGRTEEDDDDEHVATSTVRERTAASPWRVDPPSENPPHDEPGAGNFTTFSN